MQNMNVKYAKNKRTYLTDYKSFGDVFSRRNLSLTVLKAVVVSGSPLLLEYTEHLEKSREAEDRGFRMEPYDFKYCQLRFERSCSFCSIKFFCLSVIRKSYEVFCVNYFTIKQADRICKDVMKSVARKVKKFSGTSFFIPVFRTALWGNITTYVAGFTYDIFQELCSWIYSYPSKKKKIKTSSVVIWISKKSGMYVVGWMSCALGTALGAIIHPYYGCVLLSSLFEIGSTFMFCSIFDLPMS
eukprot:gene4575-9093_t